MEDRRLPCLLAGAALGAAKTLAALEWLRASAAPVTFKDVLLHGGSAGGWAAEGFRDFLARLPDALLAFALAPYVLAWAAVAAAAAWCLLALKDALPPRVARAASAFALVALLTVAAHAGLQAAVAGLSQARLAAAVVTAKRGRAFEFGRPHMARELSAEELSAAKRALMRRPLLRPETPRGPFDQVVLLEGGAWKVTAAYDSKTGLEKALVRAD